MQVSEMRAEYFPPKADIVLQKVTSTDCYIIVSGAVVSTYSSHLRLCLSMTLSLLQHCSSGSFCLLTTGRVDSCCWWNREGKPFERWTS